jgi:hypothetical protein
VTRLVDRAREAPDHAHVGEYALVTAAVASLALSIATIPEGRLAQRLPTTASKARALVTLDARTRKVPAAEARAVLARAPYRRAPLRYLFAAGWLNGRAHARECVFARVTPDSTTASLTASIERDSKLVSRLRRMNVTVAQAARVVVRGAASAC